MSEIPAELAARIPDAAGVTLTAERVAERKKLEAIGPDRAYVNQKFGRYREYVLDRNGNRVKDPKTGDDKTRIMVPMSKRSDLLATFGPQVQAEVEARNSREKHWHGKVRFTGSRVERGEGGMLWRWLAGSWMPLGVHCLGTPISGDARVPRRGIQYSPAGEAYWWQGEWVKVEEGGA